MAKVWIEFTDASKTVIGSAYPSGLGDADNRPLADEIDTSDARYATWYKTLPALMVDYLPTPG